MNCANHPAAEAKAYCQQCGKALCPECARAVGGSIFCEPCLQARLGIPPAAPVPGTVLTAANSHPVLAALLGFIPGVGAMYNGQFAKALAHVVIFAVFVSLSHDSVLFGMLVPAWVFYQVFDAYQTAKARRDGLPLPNPFGLNDLAARLGIPPNPSASAPSWTTESVPAGGVSGAPPASPYVAAPGYETVPVDVSPPQAKAPVGAIVLIAIGLLLLLHTLGLLGALWFHRGWPLLIIALGAWLLYRRAHESYPGGMQ